MAQPPTRATLLQRIRDQGDEGAWREFVSLYTPLIYSYARKQGLQHADASDVVQETLRAVAGGIARFEYRPEKSKFRAWLYAVARSKLNTHLRRALKHPPAGGSAVQQLIEEHPAPEEFADWETEYRRHMFKWASEKVRHEFGETVWRAFWLTAVEDQPPQEVAKTLKVKTGSVYVAKFRVIKRLRERIEAVTGDLDLPPEFA